MCAWQLEGSPWKCQPPWALKNIIGLRSCEHFELWSYCGVSLWFRFLISFSLLEHPRHLPTLDFDWYPKIHSHFSFKSFHLERSGPPEIHVGINIPPNSFGVQSNFFEGVSLLIGLHGSAMVPTDFMWFQSCTGLAFPTIFLQWPGRLDRSDWVKLEMTVVTGGEL